ncbi:hemophore [Mycobacterium sherrisii]|uniref:Hemophore n=1 Tax=Mycobacterium sherrisii TaxID=243061 RepID=A0A1E3SZ47_9MYCO|nr:hemophore [Mycobacterium sherrisii]MCV7028096.1 hemophore [Mycobacterium sherrisii]MEC4762745.1 hemophore [Mycobacterium sherrisii]ODR07442.1 hemophore [Mycobacterium sherrisii]ORW78774.1 Fis family transcriptional regulator [Mycobacterium sherrisii]
MGTRIFAGRRGLVAGLIAAAVPAAAVALMAEPPASGANDPCAASEVARTIGSVSKSMGDYLDSHPETNQSMTTMLQQQAGPQSVTGLKTYFEGHPKVATDMTSIAQPLTNLSMQCKLPISIPQVMGVMQQAQGAGGIPGGLPALPASPAAGLGAAPGVTAPAPSTAGGTLPGPSRQNTVG